MQLHSSRNLTLADGSQVLSKSVEKIPVHHHGDKRADEHEATEGTQKRKQPAVSLRAVDRDFVGNSLAQLDQIVHHREELDSERTI